MTEPQPQPQPTTEEEGGGGEEAANFERYTPQYPLPEEIRKLKRDDTVCQYCGVSYLIHNEIKKLEAKLKATEKELERYKGQESREAKLKEEKEKLIATNKELLEQLASSENLLARLQQELKLAKEAAKSLESRLQETSENAEKRKQQYLSALRQFSSLSAVVRQQRQSLQDLRQSTLTYRDGVVAQLKEAQDTVNSLTAKIETVFRSLQSRLHTVEMEQTVTSQSNRTLTAKLRSTEERARNLQHCEQEMERLESLNKDLQSKHTDLQSQLKDVQGQLAETAKRERNLQMEAEQFKKQIRCRSEELDQALKDKHKQAHNSEATVHELNRQLRQKEGELGTLQKQLKTLENKCREAETRQLDITQQRVLSENEASALKESLERAQGDVDALKHEREAMITAHQLRIEELRESFKRKMAEHDRWPEKLQAALAEESSKHQSQLTALESRLKESFVLELKIEKEKYDELLQKYQAQSKERNSQKMAEIGKVEARHRGEMEAVKVQLTEAKRQAENREQDLRKEIDSLKGSITTLQNKLARFESAGEEQAGQLSQELKAVRQQLKEAQDTSSSLSTALQQAREEVQFLQDTVRSECEERFELTESLSQARRELLTLRRPNGPSTVSPSGGGGGGGVVENGLGPLKKSSSISSLQSASSSAPSENGVVRTRQSVVVPPPAQVNVSYKGSSGSQAKNTPRRNSGPLGSVDDNRKRISALLGRP